MLNQLEAQSIKVIRHSEWGPMIALSSEPLMTVTTVKDCLYLFKEINFLILIVVIWQVVSSIICEGIIPIQLMTGASIIDCAILEPKQCCDGDIIMVIIKMMIPI